MGRLLGVAAAAGVALVGNRLTRPTPAAEGRWIRTNHAGATVTLAEGPVAVAAVLVGGLVSGLDRAAAAGLVAALGSGAVGAYDDLAGSADSRGFRGHLSALRDGELTTGAIKIIGLR